MRRKDKPLPRTLQPQQPRKINFIYGGDFFFVALFDSSCLYRQRYLVSYFYTLFL